MVAETVPNKVGWPTYSWMPGIHIEKDMNYSVKIDTNYSVEKIQTKKYKIVVKFFYIHT